MNILLQSIPEHDLRVRRRRNLSNIILVCDNHFFEVDELVDLVWRSCDGCSTLLGISERLKSERGLSCGDALVATLMSIVMLRDAGLLHIQRPVE
jgi:hypothetical protein